MRDLPETDPETRPKSSESLQHGNAENAANESRALGDQVGSAPWDCDEGDAEASLALGWLWALFHTRL